MHLKNIVVFTLLFCGVFQYAVATGILLNALKNTVQNIQNLDFKIIQYDHNNSNSSVQTELKHSEYGDNENNKLGSQNTYQEDQVTDNIDGDGSRGLDNNQELFEKKKRLHFFNSPSYESSAEQNNNTFEFISVTTGSSQPIINTDKNQISKDTSYKGDNVDQKANDEGSYNVVENQIRNIFKKPDINNSSVDNFLPDIGSVNYKTIINKASINRNKTFIRKEPVFFYNGIQVSCPAGATLTKDRECLYEFK